MKFKGSYNKEDIMNILNKVEIRKEGDEVATYYDGRQTARKSVSERYEIFDFRPFMEKMILQITNDFDIKDFSINILKGIQEVRLHSSKIDINGIKFHKTFYLLNSSDKSRALSLSMGLDNTDDNFSFIFNKGTITKKHYKGISDFVDENFEIDKSAFDDLEENLRGIIGEEIFMSNVQRVITKSDIIKEALGSYRKNFNNFRNELTYKLRTDSDVSKENINGLRVNTWGSYGNSVKDYIEQSDKDFVVDAYTVLKTYLGLFRVRDVVDIKRESEKIKDLTLYAVRYSNLGKILNG